MRVWTRASCGFTLIELLVALAVLAILASVAYPSFRHTLQSNHVATRVNDLVGAVALARSEAIRSSRGTGLCASAAGTSCGIDWSRGWLVWVDNNGNGVLDVNENVVRYAAGDSAVVATGPANGVVAFDSRGRCRVTPVSFSLRPADCRADDQLLRTLRVAPTGTTSLAQGECE